MNMLWLLLAISTIEWYVIDNFKNNLWGQLTWSKYITIGVSLISSFALSFAFGLDILFAVGLVEAASTAGIVLTAFALSSGSSAIAELIEAISANSKN